MNYKYLVLGIVFFLVFLFFFLGNIYGLFAIYNCLSTDFLWKMNNGKLSNCFKGDPKVCKNIDKHGIYGFCYEADYYGSALGQKEGPYGFGCVDWVFDPEDCYPETCEMANTSKRFGWCMDTNRAYLGSSCGPADQYGIRCNDWIWNAPEKCPKKCGSRKEESKTTKKTTKKLKDVLMDKSKDTMDIAKDIVLKSSKDLVKKVKEVSKKKLRKCKKKKSLKTCPKRKSEDQCLCE